MRVEVKKCQGIACYAKEQIIFFLSRCRCIHELTDLQELIVSRNLLTQLPVSSLGKLHRLNRIMAHSNQISEIGDLRRIPMLTVSILYIEGS